MFFKKKKDSDIIIQCTVCEWKPDDQAHWRCSCGHNWNTFDTKGKCPKCKLQWESTRCPGCGKTTSHKDWYKTREQIDQIERPGDLFLRQRKKSLEARLIDYGIRNYRVSHLPYVDHRHLELVSPYDAGCRMMIMYAIAYAAHHTDDRAGMIDWFKDEGIWDKVSPSEKEFLSNPAPDEKTCMELSWNSEGALTLGWALRKVNSLPRLDDDNTDGIFEEFSNAIPAIGDSLLQFLTKLEYRDLGEIHEENMVNELATTYFRDLLFNGKKDETEINRFVSFQRHKVLNWLRTHFEGETEGTGELWDEVDTST